MALYEGGDIDTALEAPDSPGDRNWLNIARRSFEASTTYMDANWRKRWEENVSLFQSRHPSDSKYNSEMYKHRSRLFRPKTRATVRKNEAAAAAAYFSNVDVVSVEARQAGDRMMQASADLMNHVVNYRLTHSVPWFKLLVGAFQEAQVYGVVPSYQYWKYKDEVETVPQALIDEFGQPILGEDGEPLRYEQEKVKVIEDKPCIELVPVENLRFDSGADWLDVVNSSPYVIRCVPMYAQDVKARMEQTDRKTGQPVWKKYGDEQIRAAMTQYDSIRSQRHQNKQDPLASESRTALTEFDIVWAHENFVRIDGEDVVYWTLGCHQLLTDPAPLSNIYWTGKRPFVVGTCTIEAHKPVPGSLVEMGSQLQREANDLVNSRADNVRLVLNKRYLTKRGANVDTQSLLRNVAGSVTQVDNIESDVREMNWPDVTASAYMEQDRLNVDFDELMGAFSAGSVQTNRQLNETVGGMRLLQGSSSMMTEYLLRTFTETWVEPTLQQLVQLEAKYETDLTVLAIAGDKAQMFPKYGINQVTDAMLRDDLVVRVNVGMGATDPNTKLQKFAVAAQTYANVRQMIPDGDHEAIRDEVFGLAGYRNGARFFADPTDPRQANRVVPAQQVQMMQQQFGQQMQELATRMQQAETRAQKAEITAAQRDLDAKRSDVEAGVIRTVAKAQQQVAERPEMPEKDEQAMLPVITALGQLQQVAMSQPMQTEAILQAMQQSNQQILMAIQSIGQTMVDGLSALQQEIARPRNKSVEIVAPSGQVYRGNAVEQ